ncbi:hypothetical protein HYX11_00415 [Candidatus Woesearchaeota archaeon]|nr:hypothetical protein [Candidatus Woesearchaeota archaeon]
MATIVAEDKVREIAGQRESALVGIISNNLEGLKAMDFRKFTSDLRENDYDAGLLDLEQMEQITNELEGYWRITHGINSRGTRTTKRLGLPSIVVYEAFSKNFREDKKYLDKLWNDFLVISHGTECPYNNSAEAVISALKEGPKESLSFFGSIPRTYKGRTFGTRQAVQDEEKKEYKRIAQEFIDAVGDENKARSLAIQFRDIHNAFQDQLIEDSQRLRVGGSVVGDYYSVGEIRVLCSAVIRRYLEPN